MADVSKIDIDGVQWDIKDAMARTNIITIENKNKEVLDVTFGGTANYSGKMRYFGEDNNFIYYYFWWETQTKTLTSDLEGFSIYPPNLNTDKILSLNLNILQTGNPYIQQLSQHNTGQNSSGMYTYLLGNGANNNWQVSGMGILRRTK